MKQLLIIPLLFLLLSPKPTFGKNTSITPVPTWVLQIKPKLNEKVDNRKITDGYFYLLLDKQEEVEKGESYFHAALKITKAVGVEKASEIAISYYPSYQKLSIHYIRVFRDGKEISKLVKNDIRYMNNEENLNQKLLYGSEQAYIALKDIRTQDVIEYAYTIKGRNPVFEGKFYSMDYLGYDFLVTRLFYQIRYNANRTLYTNVYGSQKRPVINQQNQYRIIQFDLSYPSVPKFESNIPYEEDPIYPYFSVSEAETWGEVAGWASDLFKDTKTKSESIRQKVLELCKNASSKEEKTMRIIRFVQDEIRYLGFETGVNSHKPAAPQTTLTNRYGDCKDKSALLCNMLAEINVNAWPALVSTESRGYCFKLHPSPVIFDHSVVMLEVYGKKYWIDPTLSYQRGTLKTIQFPNYKYALVINNETDDLTSINSNTVIRKKEIFEYFSEGNTLKDINLYVKTIYYGEQADEIRYQLDNIGEEELSANFLEFYNKIYSGVSERKKIEIEDNEKQNRITIHEYYQLETRHQTSQENFVFYPNSFLSDLPNPEESKRKYPYLITYPLQITLTIASRMNEANPPKAYDNAIRNSNFVFTFSTRSNEEYPMQLIYDYYAGKEVVDVKDYSQFINDLNEVKAYTGYSNTGGFYSIDNTNSGNATSNNTTINNLSAISSLLFSLLTSIFLALRLYSWDIKPKREFKQRALPGSLVLLSILLIIMALNDIFKVFGTGVILFNANLSDPFSTIRQFYGPGAYIYIILLSWLPANAILNLVLLFKSRSTFPVLTYIYLGVSFVLNLIGAIMGGSHADSFTFIFGIMGLIFGTFTSIIILLYLNLSFRVKQTFNNTYFPENTFKPKPNPIANMAFRVQPEAFVEEQNPQSDPQNE